MLQNPELKVDLEFDKLLFSDDDCTPLAIPFFYKHVVRNRDGSKRPCQACNQNPSGNVEGSVDCPYCESVGYEWVDGISEGWFFSQSYMTDRSIVSSVPLQAATANFNKIYLAFKKDLKLKESDVILKPELTLMDGRMVIPIKNDGMFKVYESLNLSSNQTQSEYNIVSLTSTFGNYFRGILKDE